MKGTGVLVTIFLDQSVCRLALKGADLPPFHLYTLDPSSVDLLHHRPSSQLKPFARSNLRKTKLVASLIENVPQLLCGSRHVASFCLVSSLVPSALRLCCLLLGQ